MTDPEKFSKLSAKIIDEAISQAQEMGHTYVGSEHILLAVCALASTPVAAKLRPAMDRIRPLMPAVTLLALTVCTAFIVDASYNPFLYFRF